MPSEYGDEYECDPEYGPSCCVASDDGSHQVPVTLTPAPSLLKFSVAAPELAGKYTCQVRLSGFRTATFRVVPDPSPDVMML